MTKSINEWTDGWMNDMNGMMDESAISLFSYFFTEPPLCWCTSSLSYVFSEQPLTWATSSLTMPWAASQLARLYSFRNPILLFVELLQGAQQPPAAILQSRLPETSQHHWCFAANQVDQRSRSANNGDSTTQIRCYSDRDSFLRVFFVTSSSRCSLVHILPAWSAKSAPHTSVFFKGWHANQALATVLFTLCQQLSQIEARSRGNTDPTLVTPGATLPKKTQGFAPESVFTREFTCVRTLTLPNYLMMGGWHDDVVDMMLWILTMTIVRNSEVV